jgi:hypothetical protein
LLTQWRLETILFSQLFDLNGVSFQGVAISGSKIGLWLWLPQMLQSAMVLKQYNLQSFTTSLQRWGTLGIKLPARLAMTPSNRREQL